MPARKLTVFLSYVREDEKFAEAIAMRITNSFRRAVELKYMALFPPGANFRNLIDEALDSADILLVIATGHEKLSHSFTGYEVGYFRKSQQTRRYIDESKNLERLIIPIAMLTEIPATLSDIEGIGIAETDRFLLHPNVTGNAGDSKGDPFFELLGRIDRILDQLEPVYRSAGERETDYDNYHRESGSFYLDLSKLMSTLPLRREMPKTKLTVRLPTDFSPKDVELERGVTLLCSGPTAGILQNPAPEQWVPWSELSPLIGPDEIALTWSDALTSLITSAVTGDFANSDPLVFSYDQKRLFRLFVSKSTTFFDRTRELDIYVVEILRYKDVGDPFTTYLAKAIAIALRYRALFLENGSPYGPVIVRFWRKETWKTMLREMLRELRLLLMQSQSAGLDERRHLIELYGSDNGSVEKVLGMVKVWSEQKAQLYRSVESVLTEAESSEANFQIFLETIDRFCTQTKALNVAFITAVLQKLANVLKVG
jgi:TIR domain